MRISLAEGTHPPCASDCDSETVRGDTGPFSCMMDAWQHLFAKRRGCTERLWHFVGLSSGILWHMRLSPLLLGGALPGTATTTRCSAEIASGDTEQDLKEASLFPTRDERCLRWLEFFFIHLLRVCNGVCPARFTLSGTTGTYKV